MTSHDDGGDDDDDDDVTQRKSERSCMAAFPMSVNH